MAKKFEDCEDLFIRYTSNTTVKDGSTAWQGKVRKVIGNEEGDVEINGCMHNVKSINVLEVLTID